LLPQDIYDKVRYIDVAKQLQHFEFFALYFTLYYMHYLKVWLAVSALLLVLGAFYLLTSSQDFLYIMK